MSEKFWQTKDFKKLQDKWYKKLEKSGFDDAEEPIYPAIVKAYKDARNDPNNYKPNPEDKLKRWSTSLFRGQVSKVQYDAKVEYYSRAGRFLHDYKFANARENRIWRLHAEGMPLGKIDCKLDKSSGTARRVVEKLVKVMMEKYNGGEDE